MPILIRTIQAPLLGLGVAAWLACNVAAAAAAPKASERQRLYQEQRQLCQSGQSGQTREACMQEARALLRDGPAALSQPSAAEMEKNALQRCEGMEGSDRQACVDRIRGMGTTSGSVQGGGIYRELTITLP